MSKYTNEIEKRRTFEIISRTYAGKTKLTEPSPPPGETPPPAGRD